MRITTSQLRRIIKEEAQRVLRSRDVSTSRSRQRRLYELGARASQRSISSQDAFIPADMHELETLVADMHEMSQNLPAEEPAFRIACEDLANMYTELTGTGGVAPQEIQDVVEGYFAREDDDIQERVYACVDM